MQRILPTIAFLLSFVWASAQQTAIDASYQQEASERMAIYNGKVENGYSARAYIGHPYWGSAEFREGRLCYDSRLYTNVAIRYDAFRQQLSLLVPHQSYAVEPDMTKVEWFAWGEHRMVPYEGTFAAELHRSKQLVLMKMFTCRKGSSVIKEYQSYETFKTSTRYLLIVEGRKHEVGSRGSFTKLFPAYKKELEEYAKQQKLNFKSKRAEALIALTDYVAELMEKEE